MLRGLGNLLLDMSLGLRLTMGLLWVTRFTLLPSNMGVTTSATLLRIMWQRLLLSTHRLLLLLLSCTHLNLLLTLMMAACTALLSCGWTAA